MARKKIIPLPDLSTLPLVRAALYRRVSTSAQVEQDLSLPEQRAEQLKFASARGWACVREYEDGGISGGSVEGRDAFQEMLGDAKAGGFEVILVWRKNRLFRNDNESDYYGWALRQAGVRILSVTEPWVGGSLMGDKIAERAMDVIAAQKLIEISEDTARSLRRMAREEGRQTGSVPYGYVRSEFAPGERGQIRRAYKGWAVDPIQAEWVRWMYREYVYEGRMDVQLCQELNARAVPTAAASTGTAAHRVRVGGWQPSVIARIMQNPVYLGKVKHLGQLHDGSHPAIVDEATWQAAQVIRQQRAPRKAETSRGLFIGGFLRCPLCHAAGRDGWLKGDGYAGRKTLKRLHRTQYYAYACNIHVRAGVLRRAGVTPPFNCPGFALTETKTLGLLTAALEHLYALLPPGSAPMPPELLYHRAQAEAQTRGQIAQRDALLRELASLPRQEENYRKQQALDLLPLDQLAFIIAALRQRRADLKRLLRESEGAEQPQMLELTPAEASLLLQTLADPALPITVKRDRLRLAIAWMMPSADKQHLLIVRR